MEKLLGNLKSRTSWFGAIVAIAPFVLEKAAAVNFEQLGLSQQTAALIGGVIILLRNITTKPVEEK